MPITYNAEKQLFTLQTANTTMSFGVFDHGYLFSHYYGKKVKNADLSQLWQPGASGFTPNYDGAPDGSHALDVIPTEYPSYGGGDFREPAIGVEFENGSRLLDLVYQSHTIEKGSKEPDGLPGLSDGDETLEVTLKDTFTGLTVILRYVVFADIDIIVRNSRIVNATGKSLYITRALSASLDLSEGKYDMISLYGGHCYERQICREPLRHGTQSVGSRRGTSSHFHNPFIALAAPETTETAGEVYGAALIYSGNFIAQADVNYQDAIRLQIGIHPADFRWKLKDGDSFVTPEAVLTYSATGLNTMSQNFHNAIKYHLGHTKFRNAPRPVVINNWEATYFNFNEEKLLELIGSCDGLGIDTFVLDDGWFGHRDNDRSSLGDWFVDKNKLPHGLTPLIEKCEAQGMTFGIWFEPEMISEDSDLYRAHPDWCMRLAGRPYCRGRHQLILDLSRDDVEQYLEKVIGDILDTYRISYVKWDMNRHFTDAYSANLPADRQPEIFHRYVLNLYKLLGHLTETFPDVLFEGCSGGGGRFDMGMLYYDPQIWTSDDSDAIERLKIQYGTSLVYPPQAMTAHVSACPNHQVGRVTPFRTRAAVAMSAIFGYELNPLSLSEQERASIADQTAFYHSIQPLVMNGDFYRIVDPFTENSCCWMFVNKEKTEALLTYVQKLRIPYWHRKIKLTGLDPDATYYVDEIHGGVKFHAGGDVLMNAGMAIPCANDFEDKVFKITKVD